ncbi:hypothetical protein AB0D65_35000 [Streptomyces griseoloalbus]|uniref:Lipoprotein n=1 Tax=Streptomyces griseoloalbus TaxID=67303 RepID=A0ABV3EGE0_9ACTN
MKRIAAIPLILASLAFPVVTSCSTRANEPHSAPDGCEEVLGSSGIKWVHDHATGDAGETIERSTMSLKESREGYLKQMESWDPEGTHWSSELCTMRKFTSGKNAVLRIEFGPSSTPFNFNTKGSEGTTELVNPDVKLHQVKDHREITHYGIYVKCKMPGTPPHQASTTPLAGVLTDTLTEGTTADARVTYLLRSTRAVVRSLKCENKPVVPVSFPTSKQ